MSTEGVAGVGPTGPEPVGDVDLLRRVVPGRRGEILDAGLAVFAERGYDRGSMREIAQRVGVSEPALYRHFANKEDLFLTLIRLAASHMVAEIGEVFDHLAPGVTEGDVQGLLEDRAQAARRYFPLLRALLLECLRRPEFFAVWRDEALLPLSARLQEIIARGDASFGRESDAESRRQRARLLMGMFLGYQITSLAFPEDDLAALTDLVLDAMGWR